LHRAVAALFLASLAACTDKTDADYRADVVASIHDSIAEDLDHMVQAAYDLQTTAPTRAWNTGDLAIAQMQESWKNARTAYEHVEGAITALFPEVDTTIDGRYEDMLKDLNGDGDPDPFDARGFTGMHAIERVLFSTSVRSEVLDFELNNIAGYRPPTYPMTDDDAIEFKTVLVQQFIDDALALRKEWHPAVIDVGAAYQGLMGLMDEQKDKVSLAARGAEESRYANITLFDLRHNVEGTQKVFGLFRAWILSKAAGGTPDSAVQRRLMDLAGVYADMDAVPLAPKDWNDGDPTVANLATPYGALWKTVHESVDPRSSGSVVFEMNRVATLLGLPEFIDRQPTADRGTLRR
jgi:iron uptake system component EfeO